MASRIPPLLSSLARHITSSSTTQSTKSITHPLNKRIVEATKTPLSNLQNLNPTTTQKKVMSFEEYKIKRMESFEEYKRSMKEVSPGNTEAMFERGYDDYCHEIYRTYVRVTLNPANDPGRMI